MTIGPTERDQLIRLRIAAMPPDQFEQLVFELAHRDDENVRWSSPGFVGTLIYEPG